MTTSAIIGKNWRATGLVCFQRGVGGFILGEIAGGFTDCQQRFARHPFGVNDVVAFQLDVVELEFVEFIGCVARDRNPVYQIARGH